MKQGNKIRSVPRNRNEHVVSCEQNTLKCTSINENKTCYHVVHLSSHFSEQLQKKKYAFDVYLKITNDQSRFHAVLITSSVFST